MANTTIIIKDSTRPPSKLRDLHSGVLFEYPPMSGKVWVSGTVVESENYRHIARLGEGEEGARRDYVSADTQVIPLILNYIGVTRCN